MELALYIQIKALDQIAFGFPLSGWLKEQFPDITLLDADNFSDDLVINQELKMIKEAINCLLFIEAEPDARPGKTVRLIEFVLRNKQTRTFIHLKGDNEVLKKMFSLGKADFNKDLTDEDLKQDILVWKAVQK